jgi:hypothetical protein
MLLPRSSNGKLTGVGGPSSCHIIAVFPVLLNFVTSLLNVFTRGQSLVSRGHRGTAELVGTLQKVVIRDH